MKLAMFAGALLVCSNVAQAQTNETNSGILVELNTTKQVDGGCQLTFVTSSDYDEGVTKVVFETVLFDTEGSVQLLTLFDFGAIPAGRPRVRQFIVPQTSCESLGQILINGVSTCNVPGVPETACADGLQLDSRTDVEMIG